MTEVVHCLLLPIMVSSDDDEGHPLEGKDPFEPKPPGV